MRVGIIIYGLDRPLTGIGRYTLELVRALCNLKPGPEITLFCAGGLGPLSEISNCKLIQLGGSRMLPALMTWGQFLIGRYARELKLDVIHDPTGTSPLAIAKKRTATVTTIHDVFALSIPGYSSFLDSLIYKYWLTRPSSRTDAIITVSKQSYSDILKYLSRNSEKIHIIPYGVSYKFRPIRPDHYEKILRYHFGISRPYVLYVGALTERKNLVRLLKAFANVSKLYPEYLLVLAGPGSWKQSPIESTIMELNLEKHVHLTGPLTDDELPALYNGASLFAFPSLYEGFGLPVLEAMACGTPVLTSNISSLPEVVGNAGVLVDPYNIEDIAQAICRLISDPLLSQEYRKLGLDRASTFSWEKTAQKTLEIYEKIGGS